MNNEYAYIWPVLEVKLINRKYMLKYKIFQYLLLVILLKWGRDSRASENCLKKVV